MRKPQLLWIIASLFSIMSAQAQYTQNVDLSRRNNVPLFNCEIFSNYQDQRDCEFLSRFVDRSFRDGGYAVECSEFRGERRLRLTCLDLSARITYNRRAFNCDYLRRRVENQCEVTQDAYGRGEFRNYSPRPRPTIERDRSTVVTNTVVESTPVYDTQCTTEYYDRSRSRWTAAKQKQYDQGRTRTVVGIGAIVGGIVLGQSRNETVRNIGTGVAIGGVVLATWGLVDMIDSDIQPPHRITTCRDHYVGEERRVIVEKRECISTRYSERGRNTDRVYYEVRCENKTYVTYDRFQPWEDGRPM